MIWPLLCLGFLAALVSLLKWFQLSSLHQVSPNRLQDVLNRVNDNDSETALLLAKKIKFKLNVNDKKLMFLLFINFMPIVLMFLTSLITGSKIRTMWMTPFYLFFGVLFLYLLKSQINLKKINSFLYGFLFLFFLSPILYSYVSISQTDKRTDYPGKEIAMKIQYVWDQDFDKEIQFVTGDEWKAGNLSYHLKSRPKWEGFNNKEILNNSSQFICVGDVCLGRY